MTLEESVCMCCEFVLWYVDDDGPDIRVCTCGHPDTEHLIKTRSCLGATLIEVSR